MKMLVIMALIVVGLVTGVMGITGIHEGGWFGILFGVICWGGAAYTIKKGMK